MNMMHLDAGTIFGNGRELQVKMVENKCVWTDPLNDEYSELRQIFLVEAMSNKKIVCYCTDCWDYEKKREKEFEYNIGEESGVYLRGWIVAKEYLNDAYKAMGKSNHADFEENAFVLEKFMKTYFFTLWRNLAKDPGIFGAFIQQYDLDLGK